MLLQLDIHWQKKKIKKDFNLNHTVYIEINSKWITELDV